MTFKYLFVDDRWIAETYGVHRRIGVIERAGRDPIMIQDRPWEANGISIYGSVLEDGGQFRMWYQIHGNGAPETPDPPFSGAVTYAESDDGLAWRKPAVGLEIAPFGKTNIVVAGDPRGHLYAPSVVRDDMDPDPSRRYKMMVFDTMGAEALEETGAPFPPSPPVPGWHPVDGEGLFVLVSPDGIAWRRLDERPVLPDPCDAVTMCMSPEGGFRAYFKTSVAEDRHFRIVGMSESRDFLNWSPSRIVLVPDWRDPPGTEFYGLAGFPYFGNYIGFLWPYRNAPDDKRMDVELATSADGVNWSRGVDRATFLGTGTSSEWDAGSVCTASAPLVAPSADPDGIWIYYGGVNVRHDDRRYRESGLGRARLRLDGFASMDAAYFTGTLTTTLLTPDAPRLVLNARLPRGWLEIDIIDGDHREPIARSTRLEKVDSTRIVVDWSGEPPVIGAPVRLRIRMRHAKLYAFWFET